MKMDMIEEFCAEYSNMMIDRNRSLEKTNDLIALPQMFYGMICRQVVELFYDNTLPIKTVVEYVINNEEIVEGLWCTSVQLTKFGCHS